MILPKEFEKRMKKSLGEEYTEFKNALENLPPYSGLRINTLKKGSAEAVFSKFGELEPVEWCKSGYYIDKSKISGNHPYHTAGLFYFQEPSAMAAAEGLPVKKGDRILDLCAAPGGKSTRAAEMLGDSGVLVSNEIIKKRAAVLSSNIERFGLRNVIVTNESPQRLSEKYEGFFDKIIVDAPCSGEGMFRKEPRAAEEWSREHTLSCAVRQRHILDCAVKMLRPEGYIIYSTCTFSPEENEQNAEYLLEKHGLQLCEMPALSTISDGGLKNTKIIMPHRQRGEGHFAALFKKPDGNSSSFRQAKNKKPPDISLYREFENSFLNVRLEGEFVHYGSRLFLKPEGIDVSRISVTRCGLLLGEFQKNRFEPSHSLAAALDGKAFKNTVSTECDSEILNSYLAGNVIKADFKGWGAVLADGYPIGWGKASSGILKNHFPKALRLCKINVT